VIQAINNGFFWIRYPDPVPLDFDRSDSEKLVLLQFYKVVFHIENSKRLLCQYSSNESGGWNLIRQALIVQGRPKPDIVRFNKVRGNDEMVNYELSARLTPTSKGTIT